MISSSKNIPLLGVESLVLIHGLVSPMTIVRVDSVISVLGSL